MSTVALDSYIVESLLPDLVGHDRRPAAFLVYLHLWVLAGGRARPVAASYATLAADTGLSRSAVQLAVKHLRRRRLLAVTQRHATDTPSYAVLRPWRRRSDE